MPLIITYDNSSMQDGLGSQALRILGIFSIAKALRIKYIHNPIIAFVEEHSHRLNDRNDERRLLREVNDFFSLPSSRKKLKVEEVLTIKTINLTDLIRLKIKCFFSRKTVVLRLLLPFNITDRFPLLYSVGVRHLRRKNQNMLIAKDLSVVHVRRGYGYLYTEKSTLRHRHLPYSYYSAIIRIVSKRIYKDREFELVVHTDISPDNVTWIPFKRETLSAAEKIQGLHAVKSGLNLPGVDLQTRIVFPESASVKIEYCADFMKTFLDMCTCKVLIQSKSSFSYLAGLINPGYIVWPSSHGHSRYPRWKNSKKLGLAELDFEPLFEDRPDI